jgi:hypothetical protein
MSASRSYELNYQWDQTYRAEEDATRKQQVVIGV